MTASTANKLRTRVNECMAQLDAQGQEDACAMFMETLRQLLAGKDVDMGRGQTFVANRQMVGVVIFTIMEFWAAGAMRRFGNADFYSLFGMSKKEIMRKLARLPEAINYQTDERKQN